LNEQGREKSRPCLLLLFGKLVLFRKIDIGDFEYSHPFKEKDNPAGHHDQGCNLGVTHPKFTDARLVGTQEFQPEAPESGEKQLLFFGVFLIRGSPKMTPPYMSFSPYLAAISDVRVAPNY